MAVIGKRNTKLVVLLCHVNADPDAICAALAFSRLLQVLRPALSTEIAAAQGLSRLSKFLLQNIPIQLSVEPHIEKAEVIVLLDTNTIQQLGQWSERVKASSAALIVIDHHASHPETERLATLCITDEKASSTCEIVYRLFKEAEVELTQNEAKRYFWE